MHVERSKRGEEQLVIKRTHRPRPDRCRYSLLQISMDMASAQGGLPALWSSEQPVLHHLVVALVRGDGTVVDAESCQVQLLAVRTDISRSSCLKQT